MENKKEILTLENSMMEVFNAEIKKFI